tara:strand:- start:556 stop:1608 length:1053 start_codon:yes stop_codon:yes gene_type:complete
MPKIKLIAIAKNESTGLASWVFHHFRIGVDLIDIYINNSDDNSLDICRLISKHEPRFSYYQADRLMSACIKNSENFQLAAYNRSVKLSQTIMDATTHFLLLDLDEYLTPLNLRSSLKALIKKNPFIDIFSFLWYSDDFKNKCPTFSKPLQKNMDIYMMDHVKSMARSEVIKSCTHHNFNSNTKDSRLLNLLVGSTDIFLDDNWNTEYQRSKFRRSFHSHLREIKPIEWFVYHRIYSSCTEYIASLLRGRSHNNDPTPIKVNRWGRAPYPWMEAEALTLNYRQPQLRKYYKDFDDFLDSCHIRAELIKSEEMLKTRARKVLGMVKENPNIIEQYPRPFLGLSLEEIEEDLR